MLSGVLAATAIAVSGVSLHIVDDAGAPVARATVVLHEARGIDETRTSAADGSVAVPADREIRALSASASGFESQDITLAVNASPNLVVHLHATVIGRVSVATGSAHQAHALPVAVSTLTSATIDSTPAFATDELLRALPGFDRARSNSAFTNYGQLRVSFAGAGTDRGIVLADGIPAQDGFGGQVDWLAYPPVSLTSVELLRGSGSALYGANALGGVLALNGFSPNADAHALPDGTLDLGVGSPHLAEDDLRLRFPLAPQLTAAVVTQIRTVHANDLPPGYQSPIDQAARSSSSSTRARVRYGFGASSLEAGTLLANDAQFEGRPNYTFDRRLAQNELRFTTTGATMRLDATAYMRDTAVTNSADQYPKAPGTLRYIQDVPTRESGTAVDVAMTHGANEIALRADARTSHGESRQTNASGALTGLGAGTQQGRGLALEDTYDGKRFGLVAGMRTDTVRFADGKFLTGATVTTLAEHTDTAFSPRVALRYDVLPSIALRLSDGGGFREPFLNELVRGYVIGATTYAPNANLRPERSSSRSIGIDALVPHGRLSFDVTSTRVRDAITFVTQSAVLEKRENLGSTQADSTTLAYVASAGRCARVRATATTQYARVTGGPAELLGARLAYVPDRSFDLGLDNAGGIVRFGLDVAYLGQAFADDRNVQPLGPALVFGANAAVPLGAGASLLFGASNLTGRRYLSSIDRYANGPEISVKLRLPLGKNASTTRCS